MTEYERAMLKLKLLELTQRHSLIALAAAESVATDVNIVAEESKAMLDKAVKSVKELL